MKTYDNLYTALSALTLTGKISVKRMDEIIKAKFGKRKHLIILDIRQLEELLEQMKIEAGDKK